MILHIRGDKYEEKTLDKKICSEYSAGDRRCRLRRSVYDHRHPYIYSRNFVPGSGKNIHLSDIIYAEGRSNP